MQVSYRKDTSRFTRLSASGLEVLGVTDKAVFGDTGGSERGLCDDTKKSSKM